LTRLLANDQIVRVIDLKPSEKAQLVEFDASPFEIESFTIEAGGDAEFMQFLPGDDGYNPLQASVLLDPQKPWTWNRTIKEKYFFTGKNIRFYLTNNTNLPNQVQVSLTATVEHPQVLSIPVTAAIFIGGALAYVLLRAFFPRVVAVAGTTMREAIYQPLFWIVLALVLLAILAQMYIPLGSFGEDIKGFKENTLTIITLGCLLVAIWTASNTIADEIEGRTALTVLSKPIGRAQFILGKYLGVMFPVLLIFLLSSAFFLACLPFKTVYDARENSQLEPVWQQGFEEIRMIVPGLALTLMQTMTLTSITVAISTRLPMIVNLIFTLTIYVLGHLLPQLVQSTRITDFHVGEVSFQLDALVELMARFFATIFPNLEIFNIHAAITGGSEVSWNYLAWTLLYTLLYSGFALVCALLLFEDRDLS
jgi:ABC-type transport system involved in multi-copper enzyme maturation permease subunit